MTVKNTGTQNSEMEKTSRNGQWIWKAKKAKFDEYVQFRSQCRYSGVGKVQLHISVDSDYMFFVNGNFVAFGQYQDYPDHRVKDVVDITSSCVEGLNEIAVVVWYYGQVTMNYYPGEAGLWYEIRNGTTVLDCSSEKVLCRYAPDYQNHRQQIITPQLGFNFKYDFGRSDGWLKNPFTELKGFENAVVVKEAGIFYERPIKKLILKDQLNGRLVQQGIFTVSENERESVKMDRAFLAFREISELTQKSQEQKDTNNGVSRAVYTKEKCDGMYFIYDLQKEESGYLSFCIKAARGTKICIGYGEHMADGRVRCAPYIRNFSFEFIASGGKDTFFATFRRLGVRYLQLFIYSDHAEIEYFGIRPCQYALQEIPYRNHNYLRQKIYEISIATLRHCMHEHYEDCPWREQALYTTDSRNQILAGYYAFGEYDFPKSCFELMLRGVNPDGFLNICFPAGIIQVIPYFNLTFFIELQEYLAYSGDTVFFQEHYPQLKKLILAQLSRLQPNGLVKNFVNTDGQWRYWNFYEWRPMLNGMDQSNDVESYDAILNAFLSIATACMEKIARAIGKDVDAKYFSDTVQRLNESIRTAFYDPKRKVFLAYQGKFENCVSVLANSLCVLCGSADGLDTTEIERVLSFFDLQKETNGIIADALGKSDEMKDSDKTDPIACTLSMTTYLFDALLKINQNKYAPYILNRIDEMYYYMIERGATTFWETLRGESDFDRSGSLCHGWSAMPVYYYHILKDYMD